MKYFQIFNLMGLCFCLISPLLSATAEESINNPLSDYFYNNQKRVVHKWVHYLDVYDRHFQRFRNKEVKVLEIGVYKGGSLQMWKHYFGEKAQIIGFDIDPSCKQYEEDQITIYIGSQEDREFLKRLKDLVGEVDIVIDDGGHTMSQQITSFEEIYPIVSSNGVYLVEDLHTSYWNEYGGGYKKIGTFIEYAKNLVDQLNAWHSRLSAELEVNDFTKMTRSIHFYDSIAIFEKGEITQPYSIVTGNPDL